MQELPKGDINRSRCVKMGQGVPQWIYGPRSIKVGLDVPKWAYMRLKEPRGAKTGLGVSKCVWWYLMGQVYLNGPR